MRNANVVTLLVMAALAGCGGSGPDDDLPRRTALLGADTVAVDTVEMTLIGLQRDLIAAMSSPDSATLGRLVDPGFRVHDTRTPEVTPVSVDGSVRPQQISFLEIVAGAMRDRFGDEQFTYSAFPDGETARVYAIGQQGAALTTWRHDRAGWQASQLITMTPRDARRTIEETQ